MSEQILLNRIRTPDGTVLTSNHRHDYVVHMDMLNGERYMVDGGRDYLRRSVNHEPYAELSVYLTDDHSANRVAFHWGTRGPEGKWPISYKPLADLATDHIQAILETQTHIAPYVRTLTERELQYREAQLVDGLLHWNA